MVKLNEISRTSTFAWSHDCLPILASGTVAGAVDINFNSSSTLDLWDIFSATNSSEPMFSAPVDNRFYALAWSKPFDKRPNGVLAGAFENGIIEFWDAEVLIKTKDLAKASIHKSDKHSGAVRTIAFNPKQPHILVSGGSKGEIYIWDTKTFDEPTTPGKAMTPMDEITSVAWNHTVDHIMASTSNGGYTSIWDLKSKREVLHLSYNGELGRANFSYVAWHPTISTKLITASDNDGCPLILTWDLRNSNAPEKILQGHKKGVLSLDWCVQDPELLLSSGKDNSTLLWNPIEGKKLGEYPTTANWAFLTKFAPNAPDIFATASFDGKIIVQSLQDTSPPVSTKPTSNDDEFWSEISTTDTQQPVFEVKQAPNWLKRPSNVSFGFGSKLVTITKGEDGKSVVEVKKVLTKGLQGSSDKITKAFDNNDFSEIIESRLSDTVNNTDKSDWETLKKLSVTDKKHLFKQAIKEEAESNGTKPVKDEEEMDESTKFDNDLEKDNFFEKLGEENGQKSDSFIPSGSFKLFNKDTSASDKKLIKLILNNQINEAVDVCLANDKLLEASVLALESSSTVKDKVRNAFFNSNKNSEFSRVLYNASSKNITDIIVNADVENWKDIANSISSFSKDDGDFDNKITELGDRILESGSSRDNAILCYLAGGSIDKIASIWLEELPTIEKTLLENPSSQISSPSDARFEALNNFAEKIATYRSLSKVSGVLTGPSIEPICKAILEYANLLAGFGQFDLADEFLKLLPDDFDGSKTDKERINKASSKTVTKTITNTKRSNYSRSSQQQVASPVPNGSRSPINQFSQQQSVAPAFRPNITPSVPSYSGQSGPGYPGQSAPGVPITPGQSQFTPIPPVQPPINPYMKPSNPYLAQNHNPYMKPQPQVVQAPPQAPPPKAYKEETEGWNDLPDTFRPKAAPRRATASTFSPAETPVPGPGSGARNASFTSPPLNVAPPKGPSRLPSRASLTSSPRPTPVQPRQSQTPPVNNPYAPAVTSPGAPISNVPITPSFGSNAPAFGSNAPPAFGANSAPPTNPYAPSMNSASNVPPPNSYAPPPGSQQPPPPTQSIVSPRLNNSAPKNPYAPPPMAMAPNSRVPSGSIPPPKSNFIAPPPSNGPSVGPPPIGPPPTGPPSSANAPQTPPQAVSQKSKYPSGDKSHISPEALPIYETFDAAYQHLKPNIPEKYIKHGEDMQKRLNILYDHLNNDDLLSKEGIAQLKEIADALKAKDYPTAGSSILSFASSFPDEVGNWHAGVKRLINMSEALS